MTMFHPPDHGYFSLSVVEGKCLSPAPPPGRVISPRMDPSCPGATHNLLCESCRSDVPDVLCGNGSGS